MDFEKLQGIWRNGAATTTITGDRFTTAQMGAEYSGRVEINEAAAPKTLSLHFETGPEASNSNHGVYEFVGDDWRFCLNMTGGPAPKEFAPSPLRGIALETMARRPAPAPPLANAPVAELQGEWAMISCVRGGERLPGSFARQGKRTISGSHFMLYFGPQLIMQGTLSSDGPGKFRLEFSSGEAPQLGIFELSGNNLKTCVGPFGGERPAACVSSKDGGETFSVWKRC